MTTEPLRIAPSRHGGHWTTNDWVALDFSNEQDWQTAIDILEDRIRRRFLNIVDQAQDAPFSGFAVMALDCLLIETLQQFYEGKGETPRGQSGEYFRRFLTRTSFRECFDSDMARMFFSQIRCGILHQAEIEGSSRIWIRQDMPLVKYAEDCGGLLIHRRKFHDVLVHSFEDYLARLRQSNPTDANLRKKFRDKMDTICKVRREKPALGILAYGSLLKDPEKELQKVIIGRIRVETPFAVEYARTSTNRSCAPTLVPVPAGKGEKVTAYVLVLAPNITETEAANILYRREINKAGDKKFVYKDAEQRAKKDAVVIERIANVGGVSVILYTSLKPNIGKVLEENIPAEERASRLASLAISSVTKETYRAQRDGIRYLSDAICCGIQTPLTDLYTQEILRKAGNSPDLAKARLWVARQQGLVS